MARIVIKNLNELKAFQKKVRTLRAALPFIQREAMDKVTNETVLTKIKQKMRLENFSKKIIDATFVGRTDVFGKTARTHFISNYVAPENNFDVSNAREEGTASGVTRFPKKVGGVLRWIGAAGEVIFRKKSTPKGIERLLIIETTIKQEQKNVQIGVAEERARLALKILGV